VDCQPEAGNVTLPQGLLPTAVLDHHPRTPEIKGVPFVDIRESFGSCTALVYEYFRERGIEPDRLTATLFYYAIRSETQELGREASVHDRRLFRRLAHLVDWELLHRVVHAPVPRSYYVTFKVALERARLYKDALFADAGELPIPDAAAEIADWLLRLDEVKWALACGTFRGKLHFSLRSVVLGAHCGDSSQKIVAGWGTAGGHGTMAGGQVKLSSTSYDRRAAIRELERRYVAVMGYQGISPTADPFAIVAGALSRRQQKIVP
jgi:nanoRNase/pAp phosphatase (c-di-AMP/oligoRNAs hydrolase)